MDEQKKPSYPKLKKASANSYYQGLLQSLYAGSEGELCAFLQIYYQHNILLEHNFDVADTLKKIWQNDLKHIELLSQAIKSVGGDPKFIDNSGVWFSPRSVDYVKDIRQMLMLDIELKEKAVIDYKTAISKISTPSLIAYLERILLDEKNHLRILKSLLLTI